MPSFFSTPKSSVLYSYTGSLHSPWNSTLQSVNLSWNRENRETPIDASKAYLLSCVYVQYKQENY